MNAELGTDENLSIPAQSSKSVRLTVTSADGQTATAKANVAAITNSLIKAGFEDLALESESNWKYDPQATDDTYTDAFFSGSFTFGNFPMIAYNAWAGYGYANETATTYTDLADQMRNAVGGGADNTPNYGVAYFYPGYNDSSIKLNVPESGVTIPGMYVTNSAWTVNYILNGDSYGSAFTTGDFFELVIEGYDAANTKTGAVTVSLADYRTSDAATSAEAAETPANKILTEWKWVDLNNLGAVNKLKIGFNVSSAHSTSIPYYVCIDEIGASNPSGIGSILGNHNDGNVKVTLPTANTLAVSGIEGNYTLRIYSIDGVLRASHHLNGASTVCTSELSTGTYVVEVANESVRYSTRVLKR